MFGKPAFGTTAASSSFGTGGSLFGTPSKPAVGFGGQQATQSGGLFGQKPLFGASTPTQQTSIFGSAQPASTASSSLFGQPKPLFGSVTTQSSAFGTNTSLFSTAQPSTQPGGLFGGGFGASATTGTTIKFEPPTATDTMLRNSTNQTINTKHMCVTAMKQYEGKSLEELRCEDYIANRKGPQASGGLTFGQANQPSTSSLFATSTPSTQSSSLFGQNKTVFGATSAAFGNTPTSTPSLFGSQPTASTSLFGPKKTGLFGATATSTASPFGQTQQTGQGLFGAKPTTSFGTQPSSLFGATSTFGTTASTASPFTFGATTSTATTAPFGQAQPATSNFGFGQATTSTTSTGLFGKPATSVFGAFGATPATSSAFGAQSTTGNLFGPKPAAGGIFGSGTTGSLFGNAATSTAPSFFGSAAAKPTTSLFGAAAGQTAFGAPTATAIAAAPAAPIVLGADVSQTLLQNALIEAQIAASPYGDSPLLKLVPKETSQKGDIPNPTSVERQMRFLASKREKGANTTTVNGPSALGSIPAAGLPISMPSTYSRNRTSVGEFTYRPVFSPPALKNRVVSPIVNLNTSATRSSLLNNSGRDDSVSALLEQTDGDLILKNKKSSNVKRLDLALLHKSMQESRNRTAQQVTALSPAAHYAGGDVTTGQTLQDASRHQEDASRVTLSPHTPTRDEVELVASRSQQSSVRKEQPFSPRAATVESNVDRQPSSVQIDDRAVSRSPRKAALETVHSLTDSATGHPAGIKLRRSDYECEPSLKELAALAENGVCHIEKGFTVRRLAYGSVFWPGPFELHDIDLDEVIHFRQHEVTVYPDDNRKPPIGEQLNRFAEVSLERVWPVDKQTKEIITDPVRVERYGFRSKLERCCASMGAKFKDYRPETGTWVFSVPHFTKYGLLDDSDDEEMPSPEQLKASRVDSRLQSAVQRARPPLLSRNDSGGAGDASLSLTQTSNNKKIDKDGRDLPAPLNISELPSPVCARGLGGVYGNEDRMDEDHILNFTQTTIGSLTPRTPATNKKEQRSNGTAKAYLDSTACLDSIIEDSMALQIREDERSKAKRIELQAVEPAASCPFIKKNRSVVSRYFGDKTSRIDGALYNGRRARSGWAAGTLLASSLLPESFSVHIRQVQIPDIKLVEFFLDLIEQSKSLCQPLELRPEMSIFGATSFIPVFQPSAECSKMIDAYIEISEKHKKYDDTMLWKLCKALFTDKSHISVSSDVLKRIEQRECVGKWLREVIAEKHKNEALPSGSALIFYRLCCGDLQAAVREAIASKRYLLAITLASFKHSSRASYRKQIDYWSDCGASEFIDKNLLKIYMIMAGMSHIDVRGKRISVTDGLDWNQAIGLYVWYYCTAETSLSQAVRAFESDMTESGRDSEVFQSIYFGLIKLACSRDYSMEVLLEPTAFCNNCFDYHVSWHLLCVLDSLGFTSISNTARHAVHVGYAEQLANIDLVDSAVFVLMHIKHASSRLSLVTDMVDRLAVKESDSHWNRIRALNVPREIIAHSRFLRAKLTSNFPDMCRYALEAGMFDEAHSLFVEQVGPSAVANDRLDFLGEFCASFENESSHISSWGPSGQVYADFYRLHQGIRGVEDDSQIGELLDLAHSLGPRLATLEAKTSLERLSIAVMSRLVFEIIARFEEVKLANLPLSMDKAVEVASTSTQDVMVE